MNYIWKKAVLTFYREKIPRENEPFAVVKSAKLTIQKSSENKLVGKIKDFFVHGYPGTSIVEGITKKYVLCWFDDSLEDMKLSFRRITGVTFITPLSCVLDGKGKKTFSAKFEAIKGKLE